MKENLVVNFIAKGANKNLEMIGGVFLVGIIGLICPIDANFLSDVSKLRNIVVSRNNVHLQLGENNPAIICLNVRPRRLRHGVRASAWNNGPAEGSGQPRFVRKSKKGHTRSGARLLEMSVRVGVLLFIPKLLASLLTLFHRISEVSTGNGRFGDG